VVFANVPRQAVVRKLFTLIKIIFMKNSLGIILFFVLIFFLGACKSAHLPTLATNDSFLLVVVKNEPGVIVGLLSSCSCLQVIRMEVVHVEPEIFASTGSRLLPLETIRLLIKIKQEGNIVQVKNQLAEMQDVISVNLR
jgi:hypothetical protein